MHRLLFNINTLLMVSFHALMRFRVCQWKLASLFTPSTKGAGLAPLPAMLTSSPPRLADFRYSTGIFEKYTRSSEFEIVSTPVICGHGVKESGAMVISDSDITVIVKLIKIRSNVPD
ncbi:hypothetical protein ARALYDRAFT_908457 [Arabidopsis lyrata subsp. lyrata]|uniref:Uncharacterized protein n=1 Tax=Arabidopsis lyrata subsp. lyrata TaxID=81972 RepID=D7LYE4_ARALL|nr:hypothetical protein ARALYDRAFT_908457 [Arabidopsis lyrata subsp. lyrata]